jgi:hypothetical protein
MVSIVTQGTSLSGPSNARYRAVIIRGTIACCLYVKVIKIVKTCAFSRGKGTNGTEAGHHPERTRISSFSLTIRTSRLEPDKPEYQFGQRRNEKLPRLTLPVIRKTGCEPQLAPNRIDIWCFCNNKGVRHEEKMAPKCIWCCWCHMTSLERCCFGQVRTAVGTRNVLAQVIKRLSGRCLSLSDRDSSLGCSRVHIITGINPEDRRMYARFVSEQRNVNIQTWPVEALAEEGVVTEGPDSPEGI